MAKTFDNDENLPPLPLPTLEETLAVYSQSVTPFLTQNELEKTKSVIEHFANNEGKILHEKLQERSKEYKNWVIFPIYAMYSLLLP